VLRTASCPASMAGPIAVRSTQFGGVGCPLHLIWRLDAGALAWYNFSRVRKGDMYGR